MQKLFWIPTALTLATSLHPATAAATYTQLHSFMHPEGAAPNAGAVVDAQGNIYGTTALGGPARAGRIWRLDTHGALTVLYTFQGAPDGRIPDSAPVFDAAGNLYGTTGFGGAHNAGAVWKLAPPNQAGGAWTETIIHSFGGTSDGANPQARLLAAADGTLYGTTVFGGAANGGIVFALAPAAGGTYTETIMYSFQGGTTDGANPVAGLLPDGAGGFYGTTAGGGPGPNGGNGTVFHLTPSAGSFANSTLHFFQGGTTDGAGTFSQLVQDKAGTLYGTTFLGGSHNAGTAFAVTPAGTETTIFNFGGPHGIAPFCGLVFDAGGRLWGTAYKGGTAHHGVVFALKPPSGSGPWQEQVAWNFQGAPDGSNSYATLAPSPTGALIGTTFHGGADHHGSVFAVTPATSPNRKHKS